MMEIKHGILQAPNHYFNYDNLLFPIKNVHRPTIKHDVHEYLIDLIILILY